MKNQNNKKEGVIGTILFHLFLILIFSSSFMSLKYQDPPPKNGIAINFGESKDGQGNNPVKIQEELPINKTKNTEQEVSTQNIKETINVKETSKNTKQENETSEDNNLKEEDQVDKKKLYKNTKGNKSNNGNNGRPEGDKDAKQYNIGSFGEGADEINSKRSSPNFLDHPLEMGKGYIEVNVLVDSNGRIIDIDDNTFRTTLGSGSIGDKKKDKLYKAIKSKLRYGRSTGIDKRNKIAKLKINFTH